MSDTTPSHGIEGEGALPGKDLGNVKGGRAGEPEPTPATYDKEYEKKKQAKIDAMKMDDVAGGAKGEDVPSEPATFDKAYEKKKQAKIDAQKSALDDIEGGAKGNDAVGEPATFDKAYEKKKQAKIDASKTDPLSDISAGAQGSETLKRTPGQRPWSKVDPDIAIEE